MTRTLSVKEWLASGNAWMWLTAGAVSLSLVMVFGLLALIAGHGLAHFWPARVAVLEMHDPEGDTRLMGELVGAETVPAARVRAAGGGVPEGAIVVDRLLVKTGNRDIDGEDFRWIPKPEVARIGYPADALVVERTEWGNFYGFPRTLREAGTPIGTDHLYAELAARLERRNELRETIEDLQKHDIGSVNHRMERLRLRERALKKAAPEAAEMAGIARERAALDAEYARIGERLEILKTEIARDVLVVTTVGGIERELPLAQIVRAYRPNAMGLAQQLRHYFAKMAEFVSDDPREANTEGGVFPAIFGTVLMVIVMSMVATPFGVVAAVYLREYARPGAVTSTIRIAVNNLAGVPSIVYGVFGLGFFVYFIGGGIDRVFFGESLPSPTFGTPGLLWSSLTLALLTVPVVIVATEEGLTRIPRAIREGSLALGATKAETIWRTVLPMATPAMMTGLILAVARAAGEVAPLMMVGVVKLAPTLPLDGNFPFLHLDRKFMHLGFHIYDVGFQSPNVEAARPLVYATALLLVLIIMSLNLAAIRIRNRLRERYNAAEQ